VASFLLLNAGAAAAALLVARGCPFRAVCAFLLVIHAVVLASGVLGWLTVAGAAVLVALALLGALWLSRRREPARADDAPPATIASRLAALAAVIGVVVWARPQLFDATRLWVWDDYTYHMVYPALWLSEHAIAAVTPVHAFTMQAWYPLSASVVATWFMLPFAASRGDALAWVSLTGVLYAAIVATGAAALLARLGCARGAWAVPVALFVTSERIGIMASSFSDADLAHAAALFAGFVFAVPRAGGERAEDVRSDAWYAALLTGFAIAVKVSAAPTALVIALMMVRRAGVRVAGVFAVSWVATAGYWYARNVVHTGNPVYPAAFLGWPGATFPQTTLREYAKTYGAARAITDALQVYLNWPRFHAMLAIVGLVGVAVWLIVARRRMTRPQRFFTVGVLAIVAVTLVLLPSTPYSAGNGMTFVSGFVHWDSMRYVALLPILGWVALGALVAGVAPVTHAVRSRATQAATVSAAIALFVIVAWSHGAKSAATAAAFHREPLFGAAAAVIDRQPPGTRVAVFGDQWIYPMFGARHDLDPVRLDGDGKLATAPIGDGMEPAPLSVHPHTFRANLAASGVGLVAVVHHQHPGRSPEWPTQAIALEQIGDARLLYRDHAVGIWKLGD
jgi:hypothetical protein